MGRKIIDPLFWTHTCSLWMISRSCTEVTVGSTPAKSAISILILYITSVLYFLWAAVLVSDILTNKTLIVGGVMRCGAEVPVLTAVDVPNEIGQIPLEQQLLVWLSPHSFPELSTITRTPNPSKSEFHQYIGSVEYQVLQDFTGIITFFWGYYNYCEYACLCLCCFWTHILKCRNTSLFAGSQRHFCNLLSNKLEFNCKVWNCLPYYPLSKVLFLTKSLKLFLTFVANYRLLLHPW